jgi:hypothetical protein
MIWLIYEILQIPAMILCYLTNWLVTLFADEKGDLPGFFRYWQTWDDSLDVEWFVKETVPKIFRYDFDRHYISGTTTDTQLASVGRDRGCVYIKDPNFTLKERIQRYFCRTLWLYRNCGYGFAFWLFGCEVKGDDVVMVVNRKDSDGHFIYISYDKSRGWLTRPWRIHMEWPIFGRFCHKHYLGWKISHTSGSEKKRCMIANRISFKIEKKH